MARFVAFTAGIGVSGFGYYLFQQSLWNGRAQAADRDVQDLTREVPISVSANTMPASPIPSPVDVVAAVAAEDYTAAAVSTWNKGVIKLHNAATSLLTSSDNEEKE